MQKKTPAKSPVTPSKFLGGAMNYLGSMIPKSDPDAPKRKLYLEQQQKADPSNELLPPGYQQKRAVLLTASSLSVMLFEGISAVNTSSDRPKFCHPLHAYFAARNADIWVQIDPYFDSNAGVRQKNNADDEKMRWIQSTSPIFYLKSLFPSDSGRLFDTRLLLAFSEGEKGMIHQYFQNCVRDIKSRKGNGDQAEIDEAVKYIESERDRFFVTCAEFLPHVLIGELFCQWVAIQPIVESTQRCGLDDAEVLSEEKQAVSLLQDTISKNPEPVFHFTLWRWGQFIDGLVNWLELEYRAQYERKKTGEWIVGELANGFTPPLIKDIFAKHLIQALSSLPDPEQKVLKRSFNIGEQHQSAMFFGSVPVAFFGYRLLLNIERYLERERFDDFRRYFFLLLPDGLRISIFGVVNQFKDIATVIDRECGIVIDRDKFKDTVRRLLAELLAYDVLLGKGEDTTQVGLRCLFGSADPNVFALGGQILWTCTPDQSVALANVYAFSGPFFCSEVDRFCKPLLEKLRENLGNQRTAALLQVIESIAKEFIPKKGWETCVLDVKHLAVLLVINPSKTASLIASYIAEVKNVSQSVSLFSALIADPIVKVEHVNCLFSTEESGASLLAVVKTFIERDTGLDSVALVKILRSDCQELVEYVNTKHATVIHNQRLPQILNSQGFDAELAKIISPQLEAYVYVSERHDRRNLSYNADFLLEHIARFLLCTSLLKNEGFVARCSENNAIAEKVFEILTHENARYSDVVGEFLCALVVGTQSDAFAKQFYEANPLTDKQWTILVRYLADGKSRRFLDIAGGFGLALWGKLCESVVDGQGSHAEVRQQCLYEDGFAQQCLRHLSGAQRLSLFNSADENLMRRLFSLCNNEVPRILYSILNNCFNTIHNEAFYKILVSYPRLAEFAMVVCSAEQFTEFTSAHNKKEWWDGVVFKPKPARVALIGSDNGLAYFSSICSDEAASSKLTNRLVVSSYSGGSADVRVAMFANPVLTKRLLAFRDSGALRIDLQQDIIPLLRSMSLRQADDPISFEHLLLPGSDMLHYLIGAVETLFSNPSERNVELLEEAFFSRHWEILFADITIEQVNLLYNGKWAPSKILNEFEKRFPDKVECFRAVYEIQSNDLLAEWSRTNTPSMFNDFILTFRYDGLRSSERWIQLLSCTWRKNISENEIFDKLIENGSRLNIAGFLRELSPEQRKELFERKPKFAKKVFSNKDILAACHFSLAELKGWRRELFVMIISDPALHQASGFSPDDLYNIVIPDCQNGGNPFSSRSGFIGSLFSTIALNECATGFLTHTWLAAPSCIKGSMAKSTHRLPKVQLDVTTNWTARDDSEPRIINSENNVAILDGWDKYFADQRSIIAKQQGDTSKQWFDYIGTVETHDINIVAQGVANKRNKDWIAHSINVIIKYKLDEKLKFEKKEMKAKSLLYRHVRALLDLPGFRPLARDLQPSRLLSIAFAEAVLQEVKDNPVKMVEYLIDICHHHAVGNNPRALNRVRKLVEQGIHGLFRLLNTSPKHQEAARIQDRLICLICSATQLLEPELSDQDKRFKEDCDKGRKGELIPGLSSDLRTLFTKDIAMRDQVCQWLLTYNLTTMPVLQAAAVVRLQLILLRSFVKGGHSEEMVSAILWQLSCLPEDTIVYVQHLPPTTPMKSSYHLQIQHLLPLKSHPRLVNLLRYAPLTSQLKEDDLVQLISTPAVARACLYYDHLFSRLLSDRALMHCVKQLGYGGVREKIAEGMRSELEVVIACNSRLENWINHVLTPQKSITQHY